MSMNRRMFLGSMVGSVVGMTGAARAQLPAGMADRRREKIEEWLRYYGGPLCGTGYLDQPCAKVDDVFRPPQEAYSPQPGDIMFSLSKYIMLRTGHRLAGAGMPSHSAICVRRPDGSLGVLEAGPFDVCIIETMELQRYLIAYHNRGRLWIRRRVTPLTPEQDARLCEAAARQTDKAFARWRMYAQITPFRHRGPIRTNFIGKSQGIDNRAYFCSELVTECLVYAGLLREECTRPKSTYPHDLFHDFARNPFVDKNTKLAPCWLLPSRWRPERCAAGCQPPATPDRYVDETPEAPTVAAPETPPDNPPPNQLPDAG